MSKRFVDETLWPEFQEIAETLQSYLSGVTDRVVRQVIHRDSSEAEVIEKPRLLPHGCPAPAKAVDMDRAGSVTDSTKLPPAPSEGQARSQVAGRQAAGGVSPKGHLKRKRKKRKKRKHR